MPRTHVVVVIDFPDLMGPAIIDQIHDALNKIVPAGTRADVMVDNALVFTFNVPSPPSVEVGR